MMNEADTRANLIDPALHEAGWKGAAVLQREYVFTDGRKLIGNKRGERLIADYVLKKNNTLLAFVEAKAENLSPTEGLEQVKNYGIKLGLHIVFSTNGHKIYQFDLRTGRGAYIERYPNPEELYRLIFGAPNPLKEKLLAIPLQNSGKQERYYQEIAIRKTMEAVGDGKKRVLLTLATGTGKTYVAFQIAYKLYEAKWNVDGADRRPKVLFLADRNILADQAINAFNYFDKDLVKITGREIRKRNGQPPTERNFYFAIYQAIADRGDQNAPATDDDDVQEGFYKLYPPDFFDVVIIDECHRGSATDDGNWRKILDHFGSALHIGLTATPRRQDNADTYQYFGEPVYQYSLIDGINDGFLTPYKVLQLATNLDNYQFHQSDRVVQGSVEKEEYQLSDFERNLSIPQRTDFIARQILQNIRPLDKTIVFCVTQQHAADMRDAINRHKKNNDPNYCVRITSNDGSTGKELLELFRDNDKTMPVIVTSSQMLTTGVDVLNVRNIVIVRQINSMTEFKQIVGRGTRLYESKDFFTIIDFSDSTDLFKDPAWDGSTDYVIADPLPVSAEEPPRESLPEHAKDPADPPPAPPLTVVELGKGRKIEITKRKYSYVSASGQTLDAEAYLREIVGHLPALYQDEAQLRRIWQDPKTRKALLQKLELEGLAGEQLTEFKRLLRAEHSDVLDVLTFLQYNRELTTYTERVLKTKADKAFFERYRDLRAKNFLYFILDQYEQYGVQELDPENLSQLIQKSLFKGDRRQAVQAFGGNAALIQQAFLDLQVVLFRS